MSHEWDRHWEHARILNAGLGQLHLWGHHLGFNFDSNFDGPDLGDIETYLERVALAVLTGVADENHQVMARDFGRESQPETQIGLVYSVDPNSDQLTCVGAQILNREENRWYDLTPQAAAAFFFATHSQYCLTEEQVLSEIDHNGSQA